MYCISLSTKDTKPDIIEYAVNGKTPFRFKHKKTLSNGIDIYMYGHFYHSKLETEWRAYKNGKVIDAWYNSGYEPFKEWMVKQNKRV